MFFTITPARLIELLKSLSKGLNRGDVKAGLVIIAARRNRVSVYTTTMMAKIDVPVQRPGQCYVSRARLINILKTFPGRRPVEISHKKRTLKIGTFSMEVTQCPYSDILKASALDAPITRNTALPKQTKMVSPQQSPPAHLISPDGYTLPTPPVDECDLTGGAGMTEPDDNADPFKPVVCPTCKSVGYFKKYQYKEGAFRSYCRYWTNAKDALELVVLNGDEKERLCPHCQTKRFGQMTGNDIAAATQTDMFENANQQSAEASPEGGCVKNSEKAPTVLDPDTITLAARLAIRDATAGTRRFAQFASNVKSEQGDSWGKVKPYLHGAWQFAGSDNDELEDISRSKAKEIITALDRAPC